MVLFNPNLALSSARPIMVDASMNLNQILRFPVVRNNNGTVFLQDQLTGQMYTIDEERYNELVKNLSPESSMPTPEDTGNPPNPTGYIRGGFNNCENQSFYFDFSSLRILPGQSHVPPMQDPDLEGLYPGVQRQCELWIDVYRCCYDLDGRQTKTEKVGEIRIARSKQYSEWVEDPLCQKPDIDPTTGKQKIDPITNTPIFLIGKRLRVRQYIPYDDIINGFPFVDGYNLKLTGNVNILQNQLIDAYWGDQCAPTWNDVQNGFAFKGIDAARQIFAPRIAFSSLFGSSAIRRYITRGKLENGNPKTITVSQFEEDILEISCETKECCFEGPCVFDTQPPGPPGFWCVEVDNPNKVEVIKNGGKVDGGTDYTDATIESALGGFVPVNLLKRIIKENGVLKNVLTPDEEEELDDLIIKSRGNWTDMGANPTEIKIKYSRLFNLSSRKYRLQIQSDYVKSLYGSLLYDYYGKVLQGFDPITNEPVYIHYLIFDTLEQLLYYANKYDDLINSILGRPNLTEERTNETREKPGSRSKRTVPGFPCEIEEVADFEDKWNLYYIAYKICYRSDGSISVESVKDGSGNTKRFLYGEEWRDDQNRYSESIPNSRKYDPDSLCCENDPDFFKPDQGTGIGSSPAIYNHTYLKYDLSNLGYEWVSSNPDDPCDCIQYKIADVYCYYDIDNVPIKLALKYRRNVKDKRTWVIDQKTGEVETRRKPTADCEEDREWRVYHDFDLKKDFIKGKRKHITRGLFNLREHMDCYLTSSLQTVENKKYYYDVTDCENCDHGPYFSVAYGHISGSGSSAMDEYTLDKTPSDAIYSQYQSICLEPQYNIVGNPQSRFLPSFKFVSQSQIVSSEQIYAINFYRDNLSDRLDAGNFQINLSYLSGSFYSNIVHTGSNVKVGSDFVMSLIDDSNEYDQGIICDGGDLISYNIVSGSLTNGIYEKSTINSYGTVYPQVGIIILDANRLDELLGFNSVTGSNINGDNSLKLFTSISGAAATTNNRSDLSYLTARNIKYKSTNHYFIRVYPHYTNYSNTPSFVTGSNNDIKEKCFIQDPQVYITSVGLYDNYRNLVAVAKLSRPIKKNFETELLIKVRLHW